LVILPPLLTTVSFLFKIHHLTCFNILVVVYQGFKKFIFQIKVGGLHLY
jgi:hypothetical protein